MKEKLPINVEVLKWARTSLGLSIDEVAARIKKSATTILAWEAGLSSPSFPQLERLAYKVYKRPIAVFFFPIVPVEDSPKTEFRTMPENFRENLSPGMIKLYRKAKTYQLYLEELYEGGKPVQLPLVEKFSLSQHSDITLLTEKLRQELRISIEEQCSWESVDTALKKWRNALEENGIFVFKDAFHNDEYSGFCIYHEKYPLVYLNNSMSLSRQIFTLFHELAHLLLHSGGVDFRERRGAESFEQEYYILLEMQCNRFANEFLVPPSIFQSVDLKVNEKTFADLARRFSVSKRKLKILKGKTKRGC